jgi:hypothetical protein
MIPAHRPSERGQSIVLLALAFITMLGFTGLAIDGGILFTERRHAQNAADAAALAGALAKLEGQNLYTAGYNRALDNGYDNNYTDNWVHVWNPPVDGPYVGNDQYVQVRITSIVDPVFAHYVYDGLLINTVTAVARARPASIYPFGSGDAVVGLAKTGCAVVWSHGSANTTIEGGGIFVNSDHPDCAFKASGSNVLNIVGGYGINVVGGFEISGGATVNPIPTTGAQQISSPTIPPPTCDTNAVRDSSSGTFTPGYTNNFNFPSGTWTLESGIYCVDGAFSVNGGVTLVGSDVLIYMMSGDVSWNGGATIQLDAMDDGPYAGLLIYQAESNTNMLKINGNSSSTFSGTIFAPSAEIQINGTGAVGGWHSQVVGKKVDLSGTSDMYLLYEGGENYMVRDPAKVDLVQ